MSHPREFYWKVAGASFLVGAAIELFMIKTGFYNIVTRLESERLEENVHEREQFLRNLENFYKEQKESKRGPRESA